MFRGESTSDFQHFVEAVARGEVPEGIPGLCAGTGETFTETAYVPGDLDALTRPDRRAWNGAQFRYLDSPNLSTLKTAASCPFSCSFCYGRNLHGGTYRVRAPAGVLDEFGALPGENVFIVDSDFLLDEKRVEAFADGVEMRGIRKWYICYARADFIAKHPDLVGRLCQIGFRAFLVGIEDERLGAWNKGTGRRVNEDCARVLRENGADCVALLLADLAFRRRDFGRVYRRVRDNGLRYASVQILTPIPPTRFYEEKKEDLLTDDLRNWDLTHLVIPAEHMPHWEFMLRYGLLMTRLGLLGWARGAYRSVTPKWLCDVWTGYWKRRKTLKQKEAEPLSAPLLFVSRGLCPTG